MEDQLQMCCEVCYTEFDDGPHEPALFRECGHSCCRECLSHLPSSPDLSRQRLSVKCFKCKRYSKFGRKRVGVGFQIVDFRNKILDQGVGGRLKPEPCDHAHLAKPKFVCLAPACPVPLTSFCAHCRQTVHRDCGAFAVRKRDFKDLRVVRPGLGELTEWGRGVEERIDARLTALGDWIKESFRAQLEAYRQAAAGDAGGFSLDKYMANPKKWAIQLDPGSGQPSFVGRTEFDVKLAQDRLEAAFLGDLWRVLPVAVNASVQARLVGAGPRDPLPPVRPAQLRNDVYGVIDDMAMNTKSSLAKYKELVEGHVALLQNEFRTAEYHVALKTQLAQAEARLAKVRREAEAARLKFVRCRKDARFRVAATNGQLAASIWPSDKLLVPRARLQELLGAEPTPKAAALLSAPTVLFFSRRKMEAVKKALAGWKSASKHKLFAKFEALAEYRLATQEKKALLRLNGEGASPQEFQRLEADLLKHRVVVAELEAVLAGLQGTENPEQLAQVRQALGNDVLAEVSYKEARQALDARQVAELDALTKAGLRFRTNVAKLAVFMREAQEEFARLQAARQELEGLREARTRKEGEVAKLVGRGEKAQILLSTLDRHFVW